MKYDVVYIIDNRAADCATIVYVNGVKKSSVRGHLLDSMVDALQPTATKHDRKKIENLPLLSQPCGFFLAYPEKLEDILKWPK